MSDLPGPAARILDAMAWLESGRIPMPWHRSLVAYAADHLPRAGGFKAAVAILRENGLVSYRDGRLVLEGEGRWLAHDPAEAFTRERYWEKLDGKLGPLERAICHIIRDTPARWTRADLKLAAFDADGIGGSVHQFRNAFAKLLAVGLLDLEAERYARSEVLYPLDIFELRGPS